MEVSHQSFFCVLYNVKTDVLNFLESLLFIEYAPCDRSAGYVTAICSRSDDKLIVRSHFNGPLKLDHGNARS